MRIAYRKKLDGFEARSLFENPESYPGYIERNIKRNLGDYATKFMSFEEISDPENPKPALAELVKHSEYNPFPVNSSHLYPEFEASVHVFTNEEMRQIFIKIKDLENRLSFWSDAHSKVEELRRALIN